MAKSSVCARTVLLRHAFCSASFVLCGNILANAQTQDNVLSYRYGTAFKEPNVAKGADIAKSIFNFTHTDDYRWGSNFFSADLLWSNHVDPPNNGANDPNAGAQGVNLIYRHVLSFNKISGTSNFAIPGFIRDVGLRGSAEINTKNTALATEKRYFSIGPQISIELPQGVAGYWNVSVSYGRERNFNGIVGTTVAFDAAVELASNWSVKFPVGFTTANFTGSFSYIAPKGKDARRNDTTYELRTRPELLFDVGEPFGKKNFVEVGVGYEIWENKLGNPQNVVPGSRTRTPMFIGKAHF
jgi:hypothetical protein